MKSVRQTSLRASLRGASGTVSPGLKPMFDLLDRFAYTDSELDLIESQLKQVPAYMALIARREKGEQDGV